MKLGILLEDGTIGNIIINNDTHSHDLIGKEVSVKLYDGNGMPIEVIGIVKEILDKEEYHE